MSDDEQGRHPHSWWLFGILPAAAVGILLLCAYKVYRKPGTATVADSSWMPAPHFAAYDRNNRWVRLQGYLGRHRILIAFYDATLGADGDKLLADVRKAHADLESQDVIVFGISRALPQQNRAAAERCGGIGFRLVTDVDGTIHRAWGIDDDVVEVSRLFTIDRAGRVPTADGRPRSLSNLADAIRTLDTGA